MNPIDTPRMPLNRLPKDLLQGMYQTEHRLRASTLPLQLLELIRIKVALAEGCGYCTDMHWKLARGAGIPEQKLLALAEFRQFGLYTEDEVASLAWCERVLTGKGGQSSWDADFTRLRQYRSLDECAELTLAVAQAVSWARLSRGLGLRAGSFELTT